MSKSAARRFDFIAALLAPVQAAAEAGIIAAPHSPIYEAVAKRVVAEGPALGKTDRWLAACAWFEKLGEDEKDWQWRVVQGTVWLAHAAE
jgi:hypothetical protein